MNRKFLKATMLGTTAILSASLAQDNFREPQYRDVQGNVTLEVWSWVPGLDKTAAEFTKQFPNIKINVVNLGGGAQTYNRLQTACRAGSGAPDVAQIEYGFLPTYIETNCLVDLRTLGASNLRSYFVPWTWRQVSPRNQEVYGIPQDTGPLAMIYRADIFKRYNIPVPRTWDEFARAGARLSELSKGQVKIGNFFSTYSPWFIALVWAQGGQMWRQNADGSWVQTLNNPTSKAVAKFWGDLIKAGYVSTFPAFTPDFWNPMAAGRIATSMEAAWGPGSFAGSLAQNPGQGAQYRVANLPQRTLGSFASGNWGGSSNVITRQSKNPQAAMLFISWLNTSRTGIVSDWNNGGLFPAAQAGLSLPELRNPDVNPSKFFGGQDVITVYQRASQAVNVDFTWAPWLPAADAVFSDVMAQAIQGRITFEQAIDQWQERTLAEARRNGYKVTGGQ
ncbi:MAG: extracellular solute-binding protein [Thermaceae bacterium]|nr:extracellular solute-binding protein [Thermaceae bacterium]